MSNSNFFKIKNISQCLTLGARWSCHGAKLLGVSATVLLRVDTINPE